MSGVIVTSEFMFLNSRVIHHFAAAVKAGGYSFLTESTTNQIFPILPKTLIEKLKEQYLFFEWREMDEQHTALRLITSWATEETVVDKFIEDLMSLNS